MLAAAFATDPVMSWLVGPVRNPQRRLGHLFAHTLRAELERECDERGVAAYLESSNPRNEPLYARYGFESRPAIALPDGGPRVTPMWRPAR